MHWNKWLRQGHRWLSIVFTATVVLNFGVLGMGREIQWVYFLPLPPLFLLLASGLYLFALPYAARWRGAGAPHDAG